MNYWNWFIKVGWKQYTLPFAVGVILLLLLFTRVIPEYYNNPLIINILMTLSIVGFVIGIAYHSITIWRKNK